MAVPIIAIEMVVGRRNRLLSEREGVGCVIERPSVGDVQVKKSIVVVIEPDAARAGSFEERAELRRAEAVREIDASFLAGVFEADG